MKHNGSTFDPRHYRYERTCEGFTVDRTHWADKYGWRIVLCVAVVVGFVVGYHWYLV